MQSFTALMALASKQTEASQSALAKENQIRIAREKARKQEEERKEKERIRLEKERLAKQKLEDQKRENRLAEERQRRQNERATADALRQQQQLNNNRLASASKTKARTTTPGASGSRTAANSSGSTNRLALDPEEQRTIEREEKQARARARLFGEPVSAHKKTIKSQNNTLNRTFPAPSSSSSTPKRPNRSGINPRPGLSSNLPSSSSTSITARQRIQQQFAVNERKPLNQVKRDRRTIEEIERDMKLKKSTTETSMRKPPIASGSGTINNLSANKTSIPAKRPLPNNHTHQPNKKPHLDPMSNLPRNNQHRSLNHTKSNKNTMGYNDGSEDDDDEESEMEEEVTVAPAIRDEIWKIMGKDRRAYTERRVLSDDEESDDMEAGADDVLEEEGRAARLAVIEDQREQEALKKHELEKRKRLSSSKLSTK